jgi:hypothetical protein
LWLLSMLLLWLLSMLLLWLLSGLLGMLLFGFGLLVATLLLFGMVLILTLLLVLCQGGSSDSQKQRQNGCASDSNYSHIYSLC